MNFYFSIVSLLCQNKNEDLKKKTIAENHYLRQDSYNDNEMLTSKHNTMGNPQREIYPLILPVSDCIFQIVNSCYKRNC